VRVSEKGQVTIPKELRDALGIGAGTEVEFERHDDAIVVRKTSDTPTRGQQLVERLRGRGDIAMTTAEIMALTRGRQRRLAALHENSGALTGAYGAGYREQLHSEWPE
jgi:antitoxin PrlF